MSRALLASPLGFLIGVALGAVGGGGSIIAIPVLVYVVGQSPQDATATSLVIVGAAAVVGLVGHWRKGRVKVAAGLTFGFFGIFGAFAGTAVNGLLDGDLLLLAFVALIFIAAYRMKTACPNCTNVGTDKAIDADAAVGVPASGSEPRSLRAPLVLIQTLAAGTLIGFFTGLFGVGGGFVIVPALTLVLGFNLPNAIGTSLLVILINSILALVARLGGDGIDWGTSLPFALAAIGGVLAGTQIASRAKAQSLLDGFAGLLVAVGLYTGVNALLGIGG